MIKNVMGGLAVAAVVIVLDQLTKLLILDVVMQPPRVIEVTGFFNLVLVYNRGVSFGLFGGGAVSPLVLTLVAGAVACALVWWMRTAETVWLRTALGLVTGGAIGNVIDRLEHGAVVDFLDFHAFGAHWPAFNLADSAIVVGVAYLVFDSFSGYRRSPESPDQRL